MNLADLNNTNSYLNRNVDTLSSYGDSSSNDFISDSVTKFISLGVTEMNFMNIINSTEYNLPTHSASLNVTLQPSAKSQLLLYDYLIPVIGTLIICLNLAVVISSGLILRGSGEPKTTYLFLCNVAMADLVTGVAVLFGQLYPKEWRNQTTCTIQLGMIISSTLASVWSVVLIAIDRFLYILQGLRYQRFLYLNRAWILIAATWIIGLVIGFLPTMGWSEQSAHCWFILVAPKELIMLTVTIGLIPVIIVIVLYSIILYNAILKVKQLKETKLEITGNRNSFEPTMRVFRGGKSSPKKIKAIKVVLFTTGSFVLTWVPYFIACSMYVYHRDNEILSKPLSFAIASPLAILGFINSFINPIIYAWWHNGFRNYVYKLMCSKKHRRNKQILMQNANEYSKTSSTKTSCKDDGKIPLTHTTVLSTDTEKRANFS